MAQEPAHTFSQADVVRATYGAWTRHVQRTHGGWAARQDLTLCRLCRNFGDEYRAARRGTHSLIGLTVSDQGNVHSP